MNRCEHCNEPLPPQLTGRKRRYCSDNCRVAAYRVRAKHFEPMQQPPIAEPNDDVGMILAGRRGDTDTQVTVAILQAQALASTFSRLGRESRPPFHWRCLGMGDAISTALNHYFEEAVR